MIAVLMLLAVVFVVRRTSKLSLLATGKVVPEAGMFAQFVPPSVEP